MTEPVPLMLDCGHWARVEADEPPPAECDDCLDGVSRSEDVPLPGLGGPS